jgi:hypothetical protein
MAGMNFWAELKNKKKVGGSPANGSKKNLKHNFQFTTKKRERERERQLTIEQFHSCVVRDLRDHSSN